MRAPAVRRTILLLLVAVVIVGAVGVAGLGLWVTANTSSTPVQPTDTVPPSAVGSLMIRPV